MAKLIKTDGTIIQNIGPSNGKIFSGEEMRKIVNTDSLNYMYIGNGIILVCDEYCWEKSNPVFNFAASLYLLESTEEWRINNDAGISPPIAGDVLICNGYEFNFDFNNNDNVVLHCYSDDLVKDDGGIPFTITKPEYAC